MRQADLKAGAVFAGKHGLTAVQEVVVEGMSAMCLFLEGRKAGSLEHVWFRDDRFHKGSSPDTENLGELTLVEEGR